MTCMATGNNIHVLVLAYCIIFCAQVGHTLKRKIIKPYTKLYQKTLIRHGFTLRKIKTQYLKVQPKIFSKGTQHLEKLYASTKMLHV